MPLIKQNQQKKKRILTNSKIKKIREDFNKLRNKCLKPKIKEIRINLYEIETNKSLSKSIIKKMQKNLFQLEQTLFKIKKYYDYDDIECKGLRDLGNLFNQSTDENYYKPIKTASVFDDKNNYILRK